MSSLGLQTFAISDDELQAVVTTVTRRRSHFETPKGGSPEKMTYRDPIITYVLGDKDSEEIFPEASFERWKTLRASFVTPQNKGGIYGTMRHFIPQETFSLVASFTQFSHTIKRPHPLRWTTDSIRIDAATKKFVKDASWAGPSIYGPDTALISFKNGHDSGSLLGSAHLYNSMAEMRIHGVYGIIDTILELDLVLTDEDVGDLTMQDTTAGITRGGLATNFELSGLIHQFPGVQPKIAVFSLKFSTGNKLTITVDHLLILTDSELCTRSAPEKSQFYNRHTLTASIN